MLVGFCGQEQQGRGIAGRTQSCHRTLGPLRFILPAGLLVYLASVLLEPMLVMYPVGGEPPYAFGEKVRHLSPRGAPWFLHSLMSYLVIFQSCNDFVYFILVTLYGSVGGTAGYAWVLPSILPWFVSYLVSLQSFMYFLQVCVEFNWRVSQSCQGS